MLYTKDIYYYFAALTHPHTHKCTQTKTNTVNQLSYSQCPTLHLLSLLWLNYSCLVTLRVFFFFCWYSPPQYSVTAVLFNILIFLFLQIVSLTWTINSCKSLDSCTCWDQWECCWIAENQSGRGQDPSASCGNAEKTGGVAARCKLTDLCHN